MRINDVAVVKASLFQPLDKTKARMMASPEYAAASALAPAPKSVARNATTTRANRRLPDVSDKAKTEGNRVAAESMAHELGFVEGMIERPSGTSATIVLASIAGRSLLGSAMQVRVRNPVAITAFTNRIAKTDSARFWLANMPKNP